MQVDKRGTACSNVARFLHLIHNTMTEKTAPDLEAQPTGAAIERNSYSSSQNDEKHLPDAPEDRPIDYDKMEHQAIGVTRIETLWRHFGTNRVVLTSLACTIFRAFSRSSNSCLLRPSGLLFLHS